MKETNFSKKDKSISIKTVSLVFAIIGFCVILLMSYYLYRMFSSYGVLVNEFKIHMQSHKYIADLYDASDNLTEQSRLFVVKKDPKYMSQYFEIVDSKSRENAKNNLERCFSNIDDGQLREKLEKSLNESNQLMNDEIHAMKLIVETLDLDESMISEAVKSYQLSINETNLNDSEKQQLALDLVFGDKYITNKQQIRTDIDASVGAIAFQLEEETTTGINVMWKNINIMVLLCILTVALFILFVVMIFFFIIRPLQIYVRCINENKLIDIVGSYEFKYLALTYNNIFEVNQENRERLKFEVEHDTLTNAYSRLAFNKETDILSQTKLPIALLIIDVDKFKNVNDSYGHEIGDQSLKRVTALLQQNFRRDDIVARIGGDEFAVILMNVYKYNIDLIGDKLNRINDILQNPEKDNIKLSLSIGIAFSEDGYKEELYTQADQALYQSKENGRCQFTVYDK